MPGKLGHLRGGHRADAVAAVVEHEPFLSGDAVTAQAQTDLRGERLEHRPVAHRRRRPEHERLRTGDVPARVRIRPANVPEEEIAIGEVLLQPRDVDDRRQLRHRRETPAAPR